MDRKVVQTDKAPGAVGPYSQGIVSGGLVFTAGQVGIDPATGSIVDGGVQAQTRQVVKNLRAVLEAAGTDLSHALKATIYLTTMDDFAAVNEVYGEEFSEAPPARSTVAVSGLPLGALVEIDVVAKLD